MDRSIIDQYGKQAPAMRQAIAGLSRQDLLAFPVPGTWSIQQIVLHLADSEGVFADRIKRVIAEENPTLLAFGQDRWMSALYYEEQSANDAAVAVEMIRRQAFRTLNVLPDSAFDRQGTHSEDGPMTLRQIIEKAVGHFDHHMKFLTEKREKLGK